MLIVNLDTHRPLVLLPGRDQRTLATWFRKYPEIQVVSRDRSGVYATAAREGAPQARQVADRWHLLKSIGDEPERMMYRHMPLIRLVVRELSLNKSPEPEISVPVASLRRPERLKQQTRKKRHQHWTEVMALHNKGCSFREISRITGLSRVTVSRWVRSGTFPEMSTWPPKRGLLDPWREWLKEQRESGNYNASRIWREMVAQGGQAVKPSSGILLPNGVKAGTHRLLLPQDFLQCRGKPLVDALENNQGRRKLCIPIY